MATGVPEVVERPERPYAAIARSVPMERLGRDLPPLNDQVLAWLDWGGSAPDGPPFWRYVVIDMARELTVEVGWPTSELLDAEGEVTTGVLPAGHYVVVEHVGHPDSLVQATGDLLAWAEREGLAFDHEETADGDVWASRLEHYLTDPADEPDLTKWVTRLEFKLAD